MEPTIGRIVIYRSRSGIDMPAIITAVVTDYDGRPIDAVHMHLFVPPGQSADILSYEWGTPQADDHAEPGPGTWRAAPVRPERKPETKR